MKRLPALLLSLMLTSSLVSGCASKTGGTPVQGPVPKPSSSPPKTVVSGVPFSRLDAPPLDTVDFVSVGVGFVGGRGVILKTNDGGQTWLKLYSGPENILEVDAVNQNDIWAATNNGYLLHTAQGQHFQRYSVPVTTSKKGAPNGLQEIKFFADNSGYVLADGVVKRLSADGKWGGATPPVPIDSITFPDAKTGFAAGANLVYKTTDGGDSWQKVFTAPVNTGTIVEGGPSTWHASIAAGTTANAWLLVYGGAAGMSQVAYVVFHTTDGKDFTPVMDEGYWSIAYPQIHLPMNRQTSGGDLGLQPGPFTVKGAYHAWFVGLSQGPYAMQLTRTEDDGASFHMTGLGRIGDPSVPNFFSPMAISFVGSTHGWIVGGNKNRGSVLYTTDGQTFRDVP